MLLMIANYDSFTYNLVQYFSELKSGKLNVNVQVYRNDEITPAEIKALNPNWIVLSPAPCTPNEAGISIKVIKQFAGQIPILGVCLGHQCIAQAHGGKIVRANKVMHGKVSSIYHNNSGVFKGLSNPFTATRYHSLVIAPESLSKDFQITAWTQNENGQMHEIMGIRHGELAIEGVQFHPESILTEHGHDLLLDDRHFQKIRSIIVGWAALFKPNTGLKILIQS